MCKINSFPIPLHLKAKRAADLFKSAFYADLNKLIAPS
jgi:hypothetical protein